jgi:hypothetical protein
MIELGNCHYGDRCNYIHDQSEIPPHFHMEMPTKMVYMPSHSHISPPLPPPPPSALSATLPLSSSPPSNKEVVESVVQAITEKASKQDFSRESSSRSVQSSQSFRESRSAHSSGRSLLSNALQASEGGGGGTSPTPSSTWNNTLSAGGSSTIYVGDSRGVQLSDRSLGSLVSERERTPGRTTTFSSFSSDFSPERISSSGGRNSLAEGDGTFSIQTHGTMLNDAMKHVVQDVVQEIAAQQRTQSPSYSQTNGALKPPPQIVHVHVHFTQAAPQSPLQSIQAGAPTVIDPLFGGGLGEGLLRDRSRSLSTSEHRTLTSGSLLDPSDPSEELTVASLRLNSL